MRCSIVFLLLCCLAPLASCRFVTGYLDTNYNRVQCFGVEVYHNDDEDLERTSQVDICWLTTIVSVIALIAIYGSAQYVERKNMNMRTRCISLTAPFLLVRDGVAPIDNPDFFARRQEQVPDFRNPASGVQNPRVGQFLPQGSKSSHQLRHRFSRLLEHLAAALPSS